MKISHSEPQPELIKAPLGFLLCYRCGGHGKATYPFHSGKCIYCEGKGWKKRCAFENLPNLCMDCHGIGKLYESPDGIPNKTIPIKEHKCKSCNGKGTVPHA